MLFQVFSLLNSESFPVKFPVLAFSNSLRLLRIHPQSYVNERQLLVEAYGQAAGASSAKKHNDIFPGHLGFLLIKCFDQTTKLAPTTSRVTELAIQLTSLSVDVESGKTGSKVVAVCESTEEVEFSQQIPASQLLS